MIKCRQFKKWGVCRSPGESALFHQKTSSLDPSQGHRLLNHHSSRVCSRSFRKHDPRDQLSQTCQSRAHLFPPPTRQQSEINLCLIWTHHFSSLAAPQLHLPLLLSCSLFYLPCLQNLSLSAVNLTTQTTQNRKHVPVEYKVDGS